MNITIFFRKAKLLGAVLEIGLNHSCLNNIQLNAVNLILDPKIEGISKIQLHPFWQR
jgi:hypothetical protein